MTSSSSPQILFTGYAPVHFACFHPLYERMRSAGLEVFVSGGLRTKTDDGYSFDEHGLYEPFGVPADHILSVEEIAERDFALLFAANTKMIPPRSVTARVQIFHGISFRNRAVRSDQREADVFFLVGPYMRRKFETANLLAENDPRALSIGFIKTDRMLNGQLDRDTLLKQFGLSGERPVVLFAPTGEKFNSLDTMGEDVIRAIADSDKFDLLIKLHDHPKDKSIDWPARIAAMENEHVRLAREPDVTLCLFVADLLISDASSVSNEYSLLDRPMVFLDVPKLIKKAEKRAGAQVDLDTWGRSCGPIVKKPDKLVDAIGQQLAHPEEFSEVRRAMAADLFYNPGCATEKAFEWVLEFTQQTAKR